MNDEIESKSQTQSQLERLLEYTNTFVRNNKDGIMDLDICVNTNEAFCYMGAAANKDGMTFINQIKQKNREGDISIDLKLQYQYFHGLYLWEGADKLTFMLKLGKDTYRETYRNIERGWVTYIIPMMSSLSVTIIITPIANTRCAFQQLIPVRYGLLNGVLHKQLKDGMNEILGTNEAIKRKQMCLLMFAEAIYVYYMNKDMYRGLAKDAIANKKSFDDIWFVFINTLDNTHFNTFFVIGLVDWVNTIKTQDIALIRRLEFSYKTSMIQDIFDQYDKYE